MRDTLRQEFYERLRAADVEPDELEDAPEIRTSVQALAAMIDKGLSNTSYGSLAGFPCSYAEAFANLHRCWPRTRIGIVFKTDEDDLACEWRAAGRAEILARGWALPS